MIINNQNSQPSISVVCATYNRSKMVRETVLAAWNQTLRPNEIVVSDDCSPDNTIEVLQELQNEVPILKIVSTMKNSGGVPNWNHVINSSAGDLIAWCSDDDQFKLNHLEESVKFLANNPDVDLVHSGFEEIKEFSDGTKEKSPTTLKSVYPIHVTRQNLVEYMAENYNWPFHPSTLVFRRKLWCEIKEFDPSYELADTDWFIRAAWDHRIVYLPYMGVLNRRHYSESGNWSVSVGSVNMQKEFYNSIFQFMKSIRNVQENNKEIEKQYKKWCFLYKILIIRIFISRCRAGNYSVAESSLLELKRVDPWVEKIPNFFLTAILKFLFILLSNLQIILPGGKRKYANLGKHVPL